MTADSGRRPMYLTVTGTRRLAEWMVRVTLTGERLPRFDYQGPDHLVRLFLPNGAAPLRLPATADWWNELRAMPDATRPHVRNYTVRRLDRTARELDIDFVLHGDAGPASAWADRARPGDRVGVLSDGADYAPPADTDWQLVVGDETALPAVAAIAAELPPAVPAVVLVETAPTRRRLDLSEPGADRIRWLRREPAQARPGEAVLAALRETAFPPGNAYAWVAGESTLATSIRRHLVSDRGLAKDRVYFCGYWRAADHADGHP